MSKTWPARRVETFDNIEKAGDYCGPKSIYLSGGKKGRVVWFLLPIHEGKHVYERPTRGSGLHAVYEPPWSFRECSDDSVEIRASIACGRHDPEGEYFHGFLDEGNIWREA